MAVLHVLVFSVCLLKALAVCALILFVSLTVVWFSRDPLLTVFTNIWVVDEEAIPADAVIVLGGLGSIPGAVVGGFTIGLIEAFVPGEWSAYKDAAAFGILFVMLLSHVLWDYKGSW